MLPSMNLNVLMIWLVRTQSIRILINFMQQSHKRTKVEEILVALTGLHLTGRYKNLKLIKLVKIHHLKQLILLLNIDEIDGSPSLLDTEKFLAIFQIPTLLTNC